MKKKQPIHKKLFLSFCCFALIPVVAIGIGSVYISFRISMNNTEIGLKDTANQIGSMVDSRLEEMKYISEGLAENTTIKRLLREPMSEQNLLELNTKVEEINSMNTRRGYYITLCGIHGQISLNWQTDGMIYRNSLIDRIKEKEWFGEVEKSRSLPVWLPYIDNVAEYEDAGKVFSLAKNIMNDKLGGEEILGFIIISIPTTQAAKILSGNQDMMFVLDQDKRIVLSSDWNMTGKIFTDISFENKGIQKFSWQEKNYYGCFKENTAGGLYTVVLTDASALQKEIMLVLGIISVVVCLSVAIIALAAWRVAQSLSHPILQLENAMRRAQAGQLEYEQVTTEISEIRSLADNYNIMVERIRNLIEEKVKEEQKRKEIEVEKANAELKFLRAQINPHFLFNTLNSIKWLAVIHGATPVEEMIVSLGKLLECSMQKGNDFITLKEEMENVKAYLKIQQMRYGNKIKTEYDMLPEMELLKVPKLILQPLVENAIIHGIDQNLNGGLIQIGVREDGEKLILTVEDNGPGLPDDFDMTREDKTGKSQRLGGIGVNNIDKRIRMIYGKDFGLHYEKGQGGLGTKAVLVIKKEEFHAEGDSGR